ncbi:ABC-2 transporter permease [Phaeacidiphilus oryzae]|uniref:ABC transporter permease n=1 Tax=Phaeacidiphilus oryzae TaxID=348818 RepID=UPI00055CF25C|nr:ABC transporter permease [Phaeacidiphilus oryzae]
MTTTTTAAAGASGSTRAIRARWLVTRRDRLAGWGAVALVGAVSGWLVQQYFARTDGIAGLRAAGCTGPALGSPQCGTLLEDFYRDHISASQNLDGLLAFLPGLVAVLIGAPLFARGFETGTHRLDWTQSLPRTRWYAARIGRPVLGLFLLTSVLAAASTLCFSASAYGAGQEWFDRTVYQAIGPVPVASTVCGLALGAVTGLVLRRTVPAVGVSAVLSAAAYAGMYKLRAHLLPMTHVVEDTHAVHGGFPRLPAGAWVVKEGTVLPDGRHVLVNHCGNDPTCLRSTVEWAEYHPAGHFWPLQFVESGGYLALALAAVFIGYLVIRGRSAAVDGGRAARLVGGNH